MKRLFLALVAAAAFISTATVSHATEVADLSQLSWLEGLWTGSKDGVETEELWMPLRGGALLALHRDIKDGRMVSYEFLRIATTGDGAFFFGSPQSAPPTPFRLVAMGQQRVTFENKAHDFPQRILYWLDSEGALHARIEGPKNGSTVSEEWVWTKLPR